MKTFQLLTKKIKLEFDENGNAITTVDPEKLKAELDNKYKVDLMTTKVELENEHLYVTVRIYEEEEKSTIGFR